MTRPTVRRCLPAKLPARTDDDVRKLARTVKEVRELLEPSPPEPEEPKP